MCPCNHRYTQSLATNYDVSLIFSQPQYLSQWLSVLEENSSPMHPVELHHSSLCSLQLPFHSYLSTMKFGTASTIEELLIQAVSKCARCFWLSVCTRSMNIKWMCLALGSVILIRRCTNPSLFTISSMETLNSPFFIVSLDLPGQYWQQISCDVLHQENNNSTVVV